MLAKILEYNFYFFYRLKPTYSKLSLPFVFLLSSVFICSCGPDEPETPSDTNGTAVDESIDDFGDNFAALAENNSGMSDDLESFLNEGETFFPLSADGAEGFEESSEAEDLGEAPLWDSNSISGDVATLDEPLVSKSILSDQEAEKALSDLEEGTISHQRSIDELRKINNRKDRTIASLTKLNQELVSEISRLKAKGPEDPVSEVKSDESGSPSEKLFGLRSEIKNLRGNLLIKSRENQDLRMRIDSLEERISVLELNPSKKRFAADVLTPKQNDLSQVVSSLKPDVPSDVTVQETRLFAGGCNLQFDAVVTALNGKNKEAFYTEFFILDKDMESVLRNGGIELSDFSGIDSYAELWARSRQKLVFVSKRAKEHQVLAFEIGREWSGAKGPDRY